MAARIIECDRCDLLRRTTEKICGTQTFRGTEHAPAGILWLAKLWDVSEAIPVRSPRHSLAHYTGEGHGQMFRHRYVLWRLKEPLKRTPIPVKPIDFVSVLKRSTVERQGGAIVGAVMFALGQMAKNSVRMISAFPSNADVVRRSRQVSNVHSFET